MQIVYRNDKIINQPQNNKRDRKNNCKNSFSLLDLVAQEKEEKNSKLQILKYLHITSLKKSPKLFF